MRSLVDSRGLIFAMLLGDDHKYQFGMRLRAMSLGPLEEPPPALPLHFQQLQPSIVLSGASGLPLYGYFQGIDSEASLVL